MEVTEVRNLRGTGPLAQPRSILSVTGTVGLILILAAFGLDVVAHGASLESLEPFAHATGILGMVLAWVGVVVAGLRRGRRQS